MKVNPAYIGYVGFLFWIKDVWGVKFALYAPCRRNPVCECPSTNLSRAVVLHQNRGGETRSF